ncbi:PAS domain S-box protein [Pontibacillus yanchengensis]|uniref:PAS domain S-box protein n=2 Tax=Pontibacillus yanchengensis TaxID=462910 RepID=A0ACC7VBA0_9BACI|nr:PAS domain-containing protein [Pontibacillus yanchengensis]MYL32886.1 PAS domain S-box protein [Pontibacillus yanchengensis]MYL51795.1 PAS domain S-box protein [Pontibacillus yanchengensis]
MGTIIESYSPILIAIAVLLTLMTTYTSLDLFTLLRTSEKNNRFIFLGGISSMGIGIWVMNFLTMLAMDTYSIVGNQIPLTILSIILGISFTGIAFYVVTTQSFGFVKLLLGSFFMMLAVFATHVTGMYTLSFGIQYELIVLVPSLLLIYGSFLFSFWVLFSYRNIIHTRNAWLKPLSAIIITAAIVEGYFLLTKATQSYNSTSFNANSSQSQEQFVIYLVLFITILITAGLLWSSTLISNRLETSDTYLNDIKFALDESSIVAITDAKGIITYVNDKFVEISKYSRDELIGQDHSLLNSGYHSKEFFKDLWRTIGTGNVWKNEVKNIDKEGSYYWVDTTIVPFLNKKGKPYQYIAIRNDITKRKEAESQVLDAMKDIQDIKFALDESSIVAITDAKGTIMNVNENFVQISKYSREELIGEDHRILNSGYHTKEFFKNLWRTIGQGHVWKGEIRNRAKDDTYYWVDTTIVPFLKENGKPYQYLAIRSDITERKKTEEVLHRQDKLAAVGQLAAGVAHEIRNPLTSMRGYAEFLQLDETDDERQEYLSIIVEEIERVNAIVEEFMLLSKPKEIELGKKNIIPIIRNVISLLEFHAKKHKVQLSFENKMDVMEVNCDEDRVKQVFLNLIKNSIEASPKGGTVSVSIQLENKDITMKVKDTGVGIPPDQLKKIGEPFYTTKKNGNGLGLMVSFKIIEDHGGKITVESEVQQGTTFTVQLPLES